MQVPGPAPSQSTQHSPFPLLHTQEQSLPEVTSIEMACMGDTAVTPGYHLPHLQRPKGACVKGPKSRSEEVTESRVQPDLPVSRAGAQSCPDPHRALSLAGVGGELGSERREQESSRGAPLPAWQGSMISVVITEQQGAVAFISPAGSLVSLRKPISPGSEPPGLRGDPAGFANARVGHTAGSGGSGTTGSWTTTYPVRVTRLPRVMVSLCSCSDLLVLS